MPPIIELAFIWKIWDVKRKKSLHITLQEISQLSDVILGNHIRECHLEGTRWIQLYFFLWWLRSHWCSISDRWSISRNTMKTIIAKSACTFGMTVTSHEPRCLSNQWQSDCLIKNPFHPNKKGKYQHCAFLGLCLMDTTQNYPHKG